MPDSIKVFDRENSTLFVVYSDVIEPGNSPCKSNHWKDVSKVSELLRGPSMKRPADQNAIGGKFLHCSHQSLFLGTILGGVTQEGYEPRCGEAILDRYDNFREEWISNVRYDKPYGVGVLPP
jgi:hypothetical protein